MTLQSWIWVLDPRLWRYLVILIGYMFNIKMLKVIFAPEFQLHDIRWATSKAFTLLFLLQALTLPVIIFWRCLIIFTRGRKKIELYQSCSIIVLTLVLWHTLSEGLLKHDLLFKLSIMWHYNNVWWCNNFINTLITNIKFVKLYSLIHIQYK